MKILIIHTKYQQAGGEDAVVQNEGSLLGEIHEVDSIIFKNRSGIRGALMFFFSIWNVKASREIKAKIRQFKPDIIHVHNWHFSCGPMIFRTINKFKIPVINTLHNYRLLCPSGILMHQNELFLNSLSEPFPWTAIRKKVYRNSTIQTFWLALIIWFHKKIYTWDKIDRFLCLTPFASDLHIKSNLISNPKKYRVKPNFTEIPVLSKNERINNSFLFVGRLSEEKGVQILLEAMVNLEIQLTIVGDGPLKSSVIEAAATNNNINYLGKLNSEQVQHHMELADALIFPSIWYEGMPMTMIEALSVKTPIIASNLGAMSVMIEEGRNGLLFEPGNSKALRESLEKWSFLDEKEKEKMRKHCYQDFMTKYSPESNYRQLLTIYSDLINEKK